MTGKEKNTRNTGSTANSKRNQQKAAKNASEPKKLINLTSEENSSASDTEKPVTTVRKPQVAQRGPPNKCTQTETAAVMDEDFAESPSSPSASSATSENSSNAPNLAAAQPQSGVVPLTPADQSTLDQVNQPRSLTAEIRNNSSSINIDPACPADNTAEHAILPESSANTSRHANTNSLMNNDEDELDSYDITQLRAAVPFVDIKIHSKTKKQCINRLENFLLDRFDSLAKVIVIKHKDTRLAVAILHNADQHKELTNAVLDNLKMDATSDAPIFHNFDPQAIHAMEQMRTIHVRNVPCRITKQNLETYFKRFGLIDTIRIRTPYNSIFQSAEIVYADSSSITPFQRSKWVVFIMGEAVRIYPANLTKEEHELRHQFTAVLRNFPRNTRNTDYMRMFSNFNAASMGILRTINNSIKPWIYINFRSEELMQAAIEISPILNGRQLVWEQPDNVRNFCPRCSNPGHKAKDCDDIRSRGRKPTPKALLDVYRKHGIVNAATKQANKQMKQQQQQQRASRARSQSRSHSRRPQVEFTPSTPQLDNEQSA